MNRLVASLLLPLALLLGGCQAQDRASSQISAMSGRPAGVAASSGTARAYFRANGITEIRYVRFPSYIADAKPIKVLDVSGLSPERDAETLALLDKTDIGSWKACYEDDRVSDGMYWTVELVGGGKVVKRIDGFNAEPSGLRFLLRACGLNRNGPRRMTSDDD